jgi:hypothetical protein
MTRMEIEGIAGLAVTRKYGSLVRHPSILLLIPRLAGEPSSVK